MSSFYDDASLVVIPSGYKTSKVYAEKPTDGSGDLAFTRTGDTATRVNSAGLIEKVRTNRVLRSETLDNAYWTKVNVSITANSIANPLDGALTADLLTVTDPSGPVEKTITTGTTQSFTAGTPYTISAYYKAATVTSTFRILAYDGTTIYTSGTIDLATIGNSTASYVSVGNGWYRFRFTFTPANSTAAGIVYLVNYQYGVAVTAGTNVYVYGAQVELGDIATAYIPTTTAAVSVGMVANTPRLDFLGSTCPRLLLEPQRINLKTYSEDFSTAAGWISSTAGGSTVTRTANYGISPDGYQNADRLQLALNGGSYADYLSANTITNGTTYTYSIYVKSLSGTVSFYFLGGTPSGNILKTATTEWTRITHTFTASSTVTYPRFLIEAGASSSVDLLIWGAQLEAGAYATSYIPTLAATATRGADACSKTGISSLIGQTEGTLFYDFVWNGNPAALGDYPVMIYGASYNDFLGLSTYASSPSFYSYVGGSNVVAIAGSTMVVGQRYKMAMAYKLNDYAFYVNGVQVGVDTSAGIPASMANLRTDNPFGGRVASTGVNQALLFKTRLTNAELATLTTL